MAITKTDCLILLTQLQEQGIDVTEQLKSVIKSDSPSLELINFINTNRELELTKFYENLRKNYNRKKSKLYINIVKEDEKKPNEVLTTLAAFNLQILLYAKTLSENQDMFLRHARFREVNQCLLNYSNTGDLISCQKLLKAIKADMKCLEQFNKQNSNK